MDSLSPSAPVPRRERTLDRLFGLGSDGLESSPDPRLSGALRAACAGLSPSLQSWAQSWADAVAQGGDPAVLPSAWRHQLRAAAPAAAHHALREIQERVLPRLSGADFARAWHQLEASAAYVGALDARRRLDANAPAVARDLVARLRSSVDGAEVVADDARLPVLETAVADLLRAYASDAAPLPSPASEASFILLFCRHVLSAVDGDERFWRAVLLGLYPALRAGVGGPIPLALADTLSALGAAAPRFDLVLGLLHYGPDERVSVVLCELLGLWVLLDATPLVRAACAIREGLDPAGIREVLQLDESGLAAVAGALGRTLSPGWDNTSLSWLDDALVRIGTAVTRQRRLTGFLESKKVLLREVAAPLGAGPGGAALVSELLRLSAQATSLGAGPTQAKNLLRRLILTRLLPQAEAPAWRGPEPVAQVIRGLGRIGGAEGRDLAPLLATLADATADLDVAAVQPHRWMSGAEPPELPGAPPGARASDLQRLLTFLAIREQVHGDSELRALPVPWVAATILGGRPPEEPTALASALHTLSLWIEDQDPSPVLRDAIQDLARQSYSLTGALRLETHAGILGPRAATWALARTAGMPVTPDRGAELGTLLSALLGTLAGVELRPRADGARRLSKGWEAQAVARLQVRFPHSDVLFLALYDGLVGGASAELHPEEVEVLAARLGQVFADAFGVIVDDPGSLFMRRTGLDPWPLQGPRWRAIFDQPHGAPAAHEEALSACLPRLAKVGAEALHRQSPELAIEAATVVLTAVLGQLHTALRQVGDPEAAWAEVQPLLNAALDTMETAALEAGWRALLRALGEGMDPGASLYWYVVLREGLPLIRQVGLGRRLGLSVEATAAALLARLAERGPVPEGSAAELERLLEALAELLRTRPPSLAALELGRLLVARAAPATAGLFGPDLGVQLDRLLWDRLDASERLAAVSWSGQIEAISARAPGLAPVVAATVHARSFPLSAEETDEVGWRSALFAVLSAAATPEHAPVPRDAVALRVVLGSARLATCSPGRWLEMTTAVLGALPAEIGESVLRDVRDTFAAIARCLVTSDAVASASARGPALAAAALSSLPGARTRWRADQLARAERGDLLHTEGDLLVQTTAGWMPLHPGQRALWIGAFQAALAFDVPVTAAPVVRSGLRGWLSRAESPEVGPPVDWAMLLAAASADLLAAEAVPGWSWMLENALMGDQGRAPEAELARLRGLPRAVASRLGEAHPLAAAARGLAAAGSRWTAALRLLNGAPTLAENTVKPKGGSRSDSTRLAQDLALVARRLGLQLAGWREDRLLDWTWDRLAAPQARRGLPGLARAVEGLARTLAEGLAPEDRTCTDEPLAALAKGLDARATEG